MKTLLKAYVIATVLVLLSLIWYHVCKTERIAQTNLDYTIGRVQR